MKEYLLVLILMAGYVGACAQTSTQNPQETITPQKIALADIEGVWYSADSSNHKIEFIKEGDIQVFIQGIRHGVNDYSFRLDNDSIQANGMAINWPPYDCTVVLLDRNTIEIRFWTFHHPSSSSVFYRRRKEK